MNALSVVLEVLLPVGAGALIGLVNFAGLWSTTRRLPVSRNPGLLLLGSFVSRTALCVGGFFLVVHLGGGLEGLLLCLLGFLLGRGYWIRRVCPPPAGEAAPERPVR